MNSTDVNALGQTILQYIINYSIYYREKEHFELNRSQCTICMYSILHNVFIIISIAIIQLQLGLLLIVQLISSDRNA